MVKRLILLALVAISLLTTGCANLNQQGNNALVGAGIGGAIGAIAGDTRIAAERGAVAGAILGLLVPVGNNQQFIQNNGQQCVQAVVDGRQGCYSPQYLQQLAQNGQQLQQGNTGCVQAVVDGRQGCYSPQYLQSLQNQRNQQMGQDGRKIYAPQGVNLNAFCQPNGCMRDQFGWFVSRPF